MDFFFRYHPTVNADLFDIDSFERLVEQAPLLQSTVQKAHNTAPALADLLGDTWAALFKTKPEIAEEVDRRVALNKPIMEQLLYCPDFLATRAYTQLDEFAACLNAIHLSDRLMEMYMMSDAHEQQRQAEEGQEQAEHLQQMVERMRAQAERARKEENKLKLMEEAAELEKQAMEASEQASNLFNQAFTSMQETLADWDMNGGIMKMIHDSRGSAQDEMNEVYDFISGFGYEAGTKCKLPTSERLKLAELLRENAKLKKLAKYTGRMKNLADKKKKSKAKERIERTSIELGKSLERVLPQELLLLRNPLTRPEFLRRYAEGQLQQFSNRGKEPLGEGPIVVLVDTSASITQEQDLQAKAMVLALGRLAFQQNRAFAVINFASADEVKVWTFEKREKVPVQTIIEIAEFYWNGGTNFQSPLSEAMKIIETSTFGAADIVMITDGDCYTPEDFVQDFNQKRKQKGTEVLSLQLVPQYADMLKPFSDKVIPVLSLFDDSVTEAAFSI